MLSCGIMKIEFLQGNVTKALYIPDKIELENLIRKRSVISNTVESGSYLEWMNFHAELWGEFHYPKTRRENIVVLNFLMFNSPNEGQEIPITAFCYLAPHCYYRFQSIPHVIKFMLFFISQDNPFYTFFSNRYYL